MPKAYGGQEVGLLGYTIAAEEIAQGCASTALSFNMHAATLASLMHSGLPDGIKKWVAELAAKQGKLKPKGYGQSLADHPDMRRRVARMSAQLEAARWLLRYVAWLADEAYERRRYTARPQQYGTTVEGQTAEVLVTYFKAKYIVGDPLGARNGRRSKWAAVTPSLSPRRWSVCFAMARPQPCNIRPVTFACRP